IGSTVPGGWYNDATGDHTFAAGYNAKATHGGAFVLSDSQTLDFNSTASNQLSARFAGGVRLVTSGAGLTLDGQPVLFSGGPGNGSGLTNLNVNGGRAALASNVVAGISITNANIMSSVFAGDGSGLINLNASQLKSGVVPTIVLPGFQGPYYGAIGGGQNNTVANAYPAVGGGSQNAATGNFSTIPGGYNNTASGQISFAAGRNANAQHQGAFVWADSQVAAFASVGVDTFNVRAQGGVNLQTGTNGVSVNGQPLAASFWRTTGNAGASPTNGNFLGTTDNQPLEVWVNNARALRIEPTTEAPNFIGGAAVNFLGPGVMGSTIGGGGVYHDTLLGYYWTNNIAANYSVIGGGAGNAIEAACNWSTVAGGQQNDIRYNCPASFIGGGVFNVIEDGVGTEEAAIGGGLMNYVIGKYATVGGGLENSARADGATVPGGMNNYADGYCSFAAGASAQAVHANSFVWADRGSTSFQSTTTNEFSIRAQNGVRIQSDTGVHLNAADRPIIVRDWDVFATNAPSCKAGIGRWGLFMEPMILTLGIPGDDISGRSFQVAKYATNGTPAALMQVNQSGDLAIGGDARVPGVLRSGSETGTSQAPNPAGMVVRRINSTSSTAGQIVARTDKVTLERDGSAGGFLIRYPALPGYVTIACTGVNTNGASVNFYTGLSNPASAGTLQSYSNAQGMGHFECSFGVTYNSGQHLTQVTLSRFNGDYFWSGTLMSTYNQ
ncbi:MAG TPA: hypothetical protein VF988_01040, partial [Verrucomicrobiae bacterium]